MFLDLKILNSTTEDSAFFKFDSFIIILEGF